jgi:hypothetical protein
MARLNYQADLFWVLAVLHHLLFGAVLGLVLQGNRQPGRTLMTLSFASMSFSVFYVGLSAELTFVAIAFLVLLFCLIYDSVHPLTDWGKGNHHPLWFRRVAWAMLLWAWFYPKHLPAWWAAPIASPLGVLPGPTLLALLAMLGLAFPQSNRLVHWAAAGLGLLWGLFSVIAPGGWMDFPLLIVAAYTTWKLWKSVQAAGGIAEDDWTPSEQPHPPERKIKSNPTWKI